MRSNATKRIEEFLRRARSGFGVGQVFDLTRPDDQVKDLTYSKLVFFRAAMIRCSRICRMNGHVAFNSDLSHIAFRRHILP
jgi:hypothetical protein